MGVSMTTEAQGHRYTARATIVAAGVTSVASILAALAPGWWKSDREAAAAVSHSASAPLPPPAPPQAPPVRVAAPPPATACRASCAGDDCPRFQIAAGLGLGELLGAARSFRQRLQLCPEVFVDTIDPLAPYALTLGSLDQATGQAALDELVKAKLWSVKRFLVAPRTRYRQRIYPPPCAGPATGCDAQPPGDADFDGQQTTWTEGRNSCACLAPVGWLEAWKAHTGCLAGCRTSESQCRGECANDDATCFPACRAQRDGCFAACVKP